MPKIIGKNGTSVNVICADLTTLVYLRDSDTWKCEYSDWAFGLFAICSVVALLLPILLIIYCCIKYNHKHSKLHHIPEYSRQTSYSSVYPEQSGRDLHTFPEDELDVHHHQPKRIGGKLYFPYPAYGTFDEASLFGSTSTLYRDIPTTQQNAISTVPVQQQAQLVPPLDPNQPFILQLSSSAPIVTSMLRDTRQYLHESHNSNSNSQDNNSLHGINKNSHNSLNDFKEHNDQVNSFRPSVLSTSSSTGSPIYIKHKDDGLPPAYTTVTSEDGKQNVGLLDQRTNQGTSLSSTNSSSSCNTTEKPSSTEGYNATLTSAANAVESNNADVSKPLIDLGPETTTVDSNMNNDLINHKSDGVSANINENIPIPVKTSDRNDSQIDESLNKSDLTDIPANPDRLLDDCEKNRILSATPNKNMISRQDFDDYLADCVLKLPEDQRNGTFLIRNSTTTPNCKVLTLYCKSIENSASLFYFKITYTDSNMMYIENTEKRFSALDDLIAFHKMNRSVLPCLLGDCLGKNF